MSPVFLSLDVFVKLIVCSVGDIILFYAKTASADSSSKRGNTPCGLEIGEPGLMGQSSKCLNSLSSSGTVSWSKILFDAVGISGWYRIAEYRMTSNNT